MLTIVPPPCWRIAGRNAWIVFGAAARLTSNTSRKRSSVMSASERSGMLVPAALTRTSTRPKRDSTSFAIESTNSRSTMSPGCGVHPRRAVGRRHFHGLRQRIVTAGDHHDLPPGRRQRIDVARPTPDDAPVTTATFATPTSDS